MFTDFINWFAGGERPYMTLRHCMNDDWLWIGITVGLDLTVAAGYVVIAAHWWRNERALRGVPAARALRSMRNIFIFCGICGYIFIPVKMLWPAWRLYDLFVAALAWFTWKYAWGAKDLKVVYHELNRTQQLSEDLEASRAEAARKSRFIHAISHDLRTPLNGLMLQASLAEAGVEVGDEAMAREALAEVRRGAAATAELLNKLLEIGRLDWKDDDNELSVFDLKAFGQNLRERFAARAEQKGLSLDVTAGAAMVETDRLKLERVLGNLVENALKFTRQGGVTVRADVRGGGLRVRVSDTGVGVRADLREHLFDEFFQGDNDARDRSKGFGLGLAIARRLARQLGGEVTLEPATGRGSTFTVRLPGVVCAAGAHAELVRESAGEPTAELVAGE